jgi:beta-glucanase (GH16 family)
VHREENGMTATIRNISIAILLNIAPPAFFCHGVEAISLASEQQHLITSDQAANIEYSEQRFVYLNEGEVEILVEEESRSDYSLVWADEFEKDGRPDPRNWRYERGFVRNRELQWYQPENARCEDGLLIIEAHQERVPNPAYRADSKDWRRYRRFASYTSASLMTKGLHRWTYGRFEMRGRIDTRAGLWPAFWTLGTARAWPGCGEIDIMEYYRGMLLANACWSSGRRWQPIWDDAKKPISELGDAQWSSRFHVWRMDWTPDEIRLFVDDALLNSIDLAKTSNKSADQHNPFREPHYLLLNLALGGTNGGDPSNTVFPARFEVDYVRVYQKTPRSSKSADGN